MAEEQHSFHHPAAAPARPQSICVIMYRPHVHREYIFCITGTQNDHPGMSRGGDGCGAVGVADRQKAAGKTGAAHLRWLVVDRRWSESNWSCDQLGHQYFF